MHILIGVFLFCFCLSFPSTNSNKTCDEVLKLMEREESEFPFIQKESSSQSIDNVMSAYHCCEEDMCNDRSHVAASATNAEASLIAAFKNSMNLIKDTSKKITAKTTEKPSYLPIPVAFMSGRKQFFVNVKNIAPDIFPNTDNSINTTETSISLSEVRDIASAIESTKQIVSMNNKTTPTVFDTFSFSLESSNNSASNETTLLSKIIATSTEATSTVNISVTFTETIVNTTITADTETLKNITSSSMDVDFEKNNSTTSSMFTANENSNTTFTKIDSTDNSKSPLPTENTNYENNITSSLIDIDVATTTTSDILNTLTPNISEVIVSDFNSTLSTPSIVINTTEVITSKTETEQKQENSDQFFRVMIRRQDSPIGM